MVNSNGGRGVPKMSPEPIWRYFKRYQWFGVAIILFTASWLGANIYEHGIQNGAQAAAVGFLLVMYALVIVQIYWTASQRREHDLASGWD
jgi:uncharacterized membrane protein